MRLSLTTLFLTAGVLVAQEATSDPIGFNKVTCLANSDTIVGVPLRKEGSMQTTLSGAPTGTGDSITLPVTATLTAGQFNATSLSPTFLPKYYVKFTGGTKSSYWYSVESNTATSITVNLNGDTLTGVAAADPVLIAEYWTLNTLFPPAGATTSWTETPTGSGNWVPNGHAIVASTSGTLSGRRSEVVFPNLQGVGINLSVSGTFFVYNGGWRKQGQPLTGDFGSEIVYPDQYFTIRHASTVLQNTIFRSLGEVETKSFIIPLNSIVTGKQDNFIGLIRSIDVSLAQLTLGGTSAFVSSTSGTLSGRKDELLVFNNNVVGKNKAPSATYFYYNGAWRKQGQPITTSFDSDVIPAGAGFMIRKAQAASNQTSFWINNPSY